MRIAYVTTDEVNLALAVKMARRLGAAVSLVRPEDPAPARFDAVLYDLDRVPGDRRPAVLDEQGRAAPNHPTAVHGYIIADDQAKVLRRHGVAVARRLHLRLLHGLCQAAQLSRATVPLDDDPIDLTWINLAECHRPVSHDYRGAAPSV
jgi:hypothetical protein